MRRFNRCSLKARISAFKQNSMGLLGVECDYIDNREDTNMRAAVALSMVLSMMAAVALAQNGNGNNPPWYPSLMASEAYDSGRTRLFEQANFTGSFDRTNVVDVL